MITMLAICMEHHFEVQRTFHHTHDPHRMFDIQHNKTEWQSINSKTKLQSVDNPNVWHRTIKQNTNTNITNEQLL